MVKNQLQKKNLLIALHYLAMSFFHYIKHFKILLTIF